MYCQIIERLYFPLAEMIHYLKNKVGVVDFANAQGPAGFEILPLCGLL